MGPSDEGIEVVIPAYNAEKWIAETVGSALRIPEIRRVCVVDDGSRAPVSGALASVCEGLQQAGQGHRLHIIRQTNTRGQRARNRGMEHILETSESKWIVHLDHDDLLEPGIVEAVRVGIRHRAAVVVPDREEFDHTGWRERKKRPNGSRADMPLHPGLVHSPNSMFTATGLVLARRVIQAGVRFDPAYVCVDDRDLISQAAQHGPLVISGELGLSRRVFRDGRNLSGWQTLPDQVEDYRRLFEKWYERSDDNGWRLQGTWYLNQVLKRGITGAAAARMLEVFEQQEWPLPFKLRLRLLRHRLLGRDRSRGSAEGMPTM